MVKIITKEEIKAKNSITREEWKQIVKQFIYNPDKIPPEGAKYFDPKIETCSSDELTDIQETKFLALVRYLYGNSPYYQRKFKEAGILPGDIKNLDDLPKLPITTKDDWSQNQKEYPPYGDFHCIREEEWKNNGWMLFSTGGTTLKPRLFTLTYHDKFMWSYLCARAFWAYGIRPGDVYFNSSVFGPYPGMWNGHFGAELLHMPIIAGGGMSTERKIMYLKETQASILMNLSSFILHLGETAKKMGIDPAKDLGVRHIVCVAEPGGAIPSVRKRMEDLFGAAVHDLCGHTECFPTVYTYSCQEEEAHCDRPINTHFSEDMAITEIVDPLTLKPVEKGKMGINVVTNLFSEGCPALRYVMGDNVIYVERNSCECGRVFGQTKGGWLGRGDHTLRVRGLWVTPGAVEEIVASFNELDYEHQIVADLVNGREEVTVRAEPLPEVPKDRWPEIKERLATKLSDVIGLRINVELCEYGTLPRFSRGDLDAKAKRVVDRRPKVTDLAEMKSPE